MGMCLAARSRSRFGCAQSTSARPCQPRPRCPGCEWSSSSYRPTNCYWRPWRYAVRSSASTPSADAFDISIVMVWSWPFPSVKASFICWVSDLTSRLGSAQTLYKGSGSGVWTVMDSQLRFRNLRVRDLNLCERGLEFHGLRIIQVQSGAGVGRKLGDVSVDIGNGCESAAASSPPARIVSVGRVKKRMVVLSRAMIDRLVDEL